MKQTENFLRSIIITGIFAVPFLAFIVAGSLFFPFITGKNFGFRIIVEIIFSAYILLAYYNAEYRPKFSWIMAIASVFIAVVFLADIFGFNPSRSFWSNYERMEGFVGFIHVFAYFIVAGSVLTKDLWEKFLHTSVWASIAMSFYGVSQLMGGSEISQGGVRLDGRFGNAAYFGGYLLFNIFLIAFLMAKRKGKDFLWYVYACAIALETYIMFATETRGSILGFFVGITITSLLFIFLDKKRPMMKWLAVGTIAFVAVFLTLVFQYKDSGYVKNHAPLARLASISLKEASPRFMVWGMAIDGFKEHPILGWGQDNFNVVFNKYYNPGMYSQEQWFDRAHDIFLDWLIAAGILGLFCYLLLFISGMALAWEPETLSEEKGIFARIRHAWKRHSSGEEQHKILERSILMGLFASYFVHNIFVFDNLFSYILFFTLLAYLHHNHIRNLPLPKNAEKNFGKNKAPVIAEEKLPLSYIGTAVVFVLCIVFYFVNWKPIMENMGIISGLSQYSASGQVTQQNIDGFKDAISYHTFGDSEAREQIVQAAMRAKDPSVPTAMQQDIFNFAREQMLLQLQEMPNDARYETFAGMLFSRYGVSNEALAHFEKAHELSPNKQTISFSLVLAYLSVGQNDKAIATAKNAYELAPEFTDAAMTYAVALLQSGKEQQGEEILVKTFGTDLVFSENIINAYGTLGRFDKIIAILKKRLESGEDMQTRLRLAAAYMEMGDGQNAISEIQKVQALNPSFKDQGDYYITQIRAGKKP